MMRDIQGMDRLAVASPLTAHRSPLVLGFKRCDAGAQVGNFFFKAGDLVTHACPGDLLQFVGDAFSLLGLKFVEAIHRLPEDLSQRLFKIAHGFPSSCLPGGSCYWLAEA